MRRTLAHGYLALHLWCLFAIAGSAAHAGTGGRELNIPTTEIFSMTLWIPANVGYTIETMNLSPYSDTVLHIQNYPDGSFLAGNDDVGTSPRSRVTIPATGSSRTVWVIVRAFSQFYTGTCTLRLTPSPGSAQDIPVTFGGYMYVPPANLVTGTHVMTVEKQGGANDTVVLVVSNTDGNAIAFDDEDGVGSMAWLHMNTACGSWCYFMIGRFQNTVPGNTTLIWDEDIHYANADGDGLGDALENAILTSRFSGDTDADGLPDHAEAIGVDGTTPVKLPYMGASPTVRDMFIEADWIDCDTAVPNLCNDPGQSPSRDYHQMRVPTYARTAVAFYAPDVKVHIDNGRTNTDSQTWFEYGSWGGASRQAEGSPPCTGLTSARTGLFHHGLLIRPNGGGQTAGGHYCFTAASGENDAGVLPHEAAHSFKLWHGGPVGNVDQVNCKPNYRSPMNYGYQYDETVRTFSRGTMTPLNPTALNESFGLGTTDPTILFSLTTIEGGWRFKTDYTTGGVDWNRDDAITTSGTVRGAPNWAYTSCEHSVYRRTDFPAAKDPTLAWTIMADGTKRMFLFSVKSTAPSAGKIQYVAASDLSACTSTQNLNSCGVWSVLLPQIVPNQPTGSMRGATATEVGVGEVALVYRNSSNKLVYQRAFAAPGGTTFTSWAYVGSGSETISGDPAIVRWNGITWVYAPSNGQLLRWEWNGSYWIGPFTQLWASGSLVDPAAGIAVATGFESNLGGTEQLYALVPRPPAGDLYMARWDSSTSRWTQISTFEYGIRLETLSRPGLAYVPSPGNSTEGRFFLAYNPSATSDVLFMTMTEGNDSSVGTPLPEVPRQLHWKLPVEAYDQGYRVHGPVALLYDRRVDDRLRMAHRTDPNADGDMTIPSGDVMRFAPLADSVLPFTLYDIDDFNYIRLRLACSLTASCP